MSELFTATPQPSPAARSRAARREEWLDRIARFPLSGLTTAQFCAIEAVSLPSFYSWKRRFAAEALLTEAGLDKPTRPAPSLLPVRLHGTDASLELVLTTGLVLRIPPGSDLDLVRAVLNTLGAKPC
jgi:hypothetical protein